MQAKTTSMNLSRQIEESCNIFLGDALKIFSVQDLHDRAVFTFPTKFKLIY